MTSALKLYEKAASAEREAMARMILPVRFPAEYCTSVP
jgi:hypothetical protein